ncbi:DUF4135 domain-containing protein [Streptacidiphilus sp. N1-12]|uniref:DUF4135 domain-containing protein n=2 Tax=Streptacidiphilus alkalitolerans TaxID=3342712 RepID=A0ABV6V3Q6_9ACTN
MTLDLEAWTPAVGDRPADEALLPDLYRGDERLRAVLAAAASFPDRVAAGSPGSYFSSEPASARGELNAVLQTWLTRAAGDPASAGVLLEHLAATGRPLGDGLRKVALRDRDRLPDWAQALASFLRAQPAEPSPATTAAGALNASFRNAAGVLLPSQAGQVLGVQVSDRAREDLTGTLVARLGEACRLSFCYELQAATGRTGAIDWDSSDGLDASQQGWLARLERLPGLAYLVGVVCRNWQFVYVELFARLAADRELLRAELWDGADPGALDHVRGDAGDRHAGGHSVALLHFENGQGAVYKPKDMRHGTAYMEFVNHLNTSDLPLDLPVRTILPRSDHGDDGLGGSLAAGTGSEYGWEELVPASPCADRAGFARFYRRLGMTIRLVQLLEGRDLWADNLLACGEHPVITDLECLLYPRVQTPPALPAGQRGLLDLLETTVVRTAMAAQPWVAAKDQPALDIGCLTRAGGYDGDPGAPTLPLPPYRPVHGTETADPWQYTDEVVAGYREMHRSLRSLRSELAAEDGPLAGFRGIWVRYIWRHTWDGYKILNASTSPLALTDGATRETVIAGALRGAVAARAGDPERDDLLEVVLSELDSFRDLDIPFFRSLTTSSSVFTVDGTEIPGHFQNTAWRRLMGRVDELEDFDLDAHTAVLTGCVDAALGGSEQPPVPSGTVTAAGTAAGTAAVLSPGELLEQAVRIGDRILVDRHRTSGGSGWIGLSWYPLTGLRQVEVLGGVDLVSSGVGVALFLAELWTATGEPRFRQAAHDTLAAAGAMVDPGSPHAFAFATDGRLALGAPVPGGLAGPGALIHALARGGQLLAEPEFLTLAQALVPGALALTRTTGGGKRPAPFQDAPLGTSGLLLNLLRLRRATPVPTPELDTAVRTLAALAVEQLTDSEAKFIGAQRFLDLVPTGVDSVAAALARTLAQAPELVAAPDVLRGLLREHRFDVFTRSGRLSCLEAAVSLGTDAVHSGDLGLLAAPVGVAQVASLGSRALVATAGEALSAAEAGLLHTVPEGRPALVPGPFYDGREAAGALVAELFARRGAGGSWYRDRAADDRINLSVLDGSPAVGLLLLRLLDPAAAPLTTLR